MTASWKHLGASCERLGAIQSISVVVVVIVVIVVVVVAGVVVAVVVVAVGVVAAVVVVVASKGPAYRMSLPRPCSTSLRRSGSRVYTYACVPLLRRTG